MGLTGEIVGKKDDDKDMEQYTVRIRKGLPEAMRAAKPKGTTIGHFWTTAIQLWLDLPKDHRKNLLMGETEPNSFVAVVRKIVDDRIAEGEKLGETLASPHRRKPDRKDQHQ